MNDLIEGLDFLQEEEEDVSKKKIKLLIVDDNEDVHSISKLIFSDFTYKDYELEIFNAYSGKEAKEYMNKHDDIAIILLDVVMETDTAGLDVVRYIREDLDNSFVRIILRTGQPGKAPEDEIIKEYEINNYIAKTEGSIQKVYTALYSAIRSYNDLIKINHSKKGLEKVVKSSKQLFKYSSFMNFYQGILYQLTHLLEFEENAFIASANYNFTGAVLVKENKNEHILTGVGSFEKYIDKSINEVLDKETIEKIRNQKTGEVTFYEKFYVCSWSLNEDSVKNYIYIENDKEIDDTTKKMIRLIINNFSLAISNFSLNHEIQDSQKDMIFKLGDVIETRLRDNHNHIYRVSEISVLIAKEYGIGKKEIELLKTVAPLHDIGKIAISDEILLKPGKLNDEEFERVKKHTVYGAKLIEYKSQRIFELASEIARHHHEKWDGSGYPDHLKKDDISVFSRIVSVADVFDALSHDRCYKDAWSLEKIVNYFKEEKGDSFDPKIVDILLNNLDNIKDIMKKFPA
ncbi:MAG: DUF3369 domain-containing protein [Bacillota bacterium]